MVDELSYSTICRIDVLSYSTKRRVDEMVFDKMSWKHNFGLSVCNRVKTNEYTFKKSNSVTSFLAPF